ncbi:hypothetical protein C2E21_2352 [Chlorella sorokiniana]|uniref:Uncharacterized protein n=1 Tax=Chlorella sorokiniana TaxID=3076 RepID=A0A2P6TXT2_CHLSO|nr:hypothetical protein C2E21_2352 [Chlorella sorokiniana]|eukprot:PRW58879.1 hypothetical protein C2E21_2352 [Chlorella sorokiniana]
MGLSDERLLQLAGLSAGLHNAWLLASPRSFHDFHLTQGQAYSPTSLRFAGLAGTTATAQMVAVGASKPNKARLVCQHAHSACLHEVALQRAETANLSPAF